MKAFLKKTPLMKFVISSMVFFALFQARAENQRLVDFSASQSTEFYEEVDRNQVTYFLENQFQNIISDLTRNIPNFNYLGVRTQASRDISFPYERGYFNDELIINFSGIIKKHKKGELFRVLGLSIFEAILGKVSSDYQCQLLDNDFDHSHYYYTSSIIDPSVLHSHTCALYEGWARLFVSVAMEVEDNQTNLVNQSLENVWQINTTLFKAEKSSNDFYQDLINAAIQLSHAENDCSSQYDNNSKITTCSMADIPSTLKQLQNVQEQCDVMLYSGQINEHEAAHYCPPLS